MFDNFLEKYRVRNCLFFHYGSTTYGTSNKRSDVDFIAVSEDFTSDKYLEGPEYTEGLLNVKAYNCNDFQTHLTNHKPFALECFHYILNESCRRNFKFELDLVTLRREFATKSSNSWVKAKKKLTIEENQQYIAIKSLFHSLRLVVFATQIAQTGKIFDFKAANHYWFDIQNTGYDWEVLKAKFQPEYNRLNTEFRKVAPK